MENMPVQLSIATVLKQNPVADHLASAASGTASQQISGDC